MRTMPTRAVVTMLAAMLAQSPLAAQQGSLTEAHEDRAQSSEPLFNDEDLSFLRHMSMHHEQALTMAALVPERTERDELARFARYVSRAQAAEIDLMGSLLELADRRGRDVPAHGPHGDPPMPGMLSSAEMAALESASGPEFERLWLEGMIFHHEGGLAMARAQQLQQLAHDRRPYGFHVLVEDILIEQRAEIAKMDGWLDDWGLRRETAAADAVPPVAGITSPAPGATVARGQIVLVGTAVDDGGPIAGVRVGIRDLATDDWWRSGGWGEHQLHEAEVVASGPGSAAWQYAWTPPGPGRYAVVVEVEDGAGNRGAGMGERDFGVR